MKLNHILFAQTIFFISFLFASLANSDETAQQAGFLPFGPGAIDSLNAALTGSPDFQIRIHAPVEDTQDTLASLDSLLKLEEAERRSDEEDYVSEKQRMLNVHKNRIRDMVFSAFEPIHGMIPNPITTEVIEGSASVDCKVAKTSKGAVGAPELEIDWPGRIVAVGDLHGDAENALMLLDALGVVDRKTRKWKGGDTLLIQTGDIIDRGPDGLILYDLFEQWAAEAHAAGGKVIVLLGNHDAMNLCGDFRYAHHKETAQFGGLSRRRAAFSEEGKYGSLLLTLASAVRINGIVFSHAGVTPRFAALGLLRLHELLSEELRSGCALHYKKHHGETPEGLFVTGEDGPLWTRHYTLTPSYVACPALDEALGLLQAEAMVVGHTVQESLSVETRCEGKLVAIDTGISRYVANSPRGIEVTCDGSFYEVAVQPGRRDEKDENKINFSKRKLNAKAEKYYKHRKASVTGNAWIIAAELSGDL